MVPKVLLSRFFTLDGSPVNIRSFVQSRVSEGRFDAADIEEIRSLNVGDEIRYGVKKSETVLRRVR